MRYLRLMKLFLHASVLQELAYRANFWISLLHALLELSVAVTGLVVLFGQVQMLRGWTFASTLALLGVYLTISALRGLVVGPSLEALMGMDGEMWTGKLDYTLLRPANIQFLASFRNWRPFRLVDLALGIGVLAWALLLPEQQFDARHLALFLLTFTSGAVLLYAILLAFTSLTFWNPGFLFTWVFDAIFQLARYPVGIYPAWLRILLTWAVPVGLVTTFPAQALTGDLPPVAALGSALAAAALLAGASLLFRIGVRRYASASS